jgi:hypothetical protein
MSNLTVRVTVVGHASRRWRGAGSPAKADGLNQQLSESRAQNLRRPVEEILKRELPGVTIEAPAKGVGSHEGFPLAGEDNAAIDRSVVVMVELTTSDAISRTRLRPSRLYVPSVWWTLKVVNMVGGSIGVKGTFMRVIVQNALTGHELTLAGYLFGGSLSPPNLKDQIKFDGGDPRKRLPDLLKPVGDIVTFGTKHAEDFDFFTKPDNGQWVRVIHAGIGAIRKRETTFLQFTDLDTDPGSLVFEYKKGWSMPTYNLSVVTGVLKVEGDVPTDYVASTTMETISTVDVHHNYDALLVTFPTGKSGLHDLTSRDQKRLTDFVTNKARAIAALTSTGFPLANRRP